MLCMREETPGFIPDIAAHTHADSPLPDAERHARNAKDQYNPAGWQYRSRTTGKTVGRVKRSVPVRNGALVSGVPVFVGADLVRDAMCKKQSRTRSAPTGVPFQPTDVSIGVGAHLVRDQINHQVPIYIR